MDCSSVSRPSGLRLRRRRPMSEGEESNLLHAGNLGDARRDLRTSICRMCDGKRLHPLDQHHTRPHSGFRRRCFRAMLWSSAAESYDELLERKGVTVQEPCPTSQPMRRSASDCAEVSTPIATAAHWSSWANQSGLTQMAWRICMAWATYFGLSLISEIGRHRVRARSNLR